MQTIELNNGVKMPLLGYGVFMVDPKECERCVTDAINTGYRLIDTAQAYYNEEGVGEAISKTSVPRDELFIVTKIWISNAGEKKAAASIEASLRKLKTEYIDLLLIHQPYGDYYGTYRAMEQALKAGKVRAIGVSNFKTGRFTDLALHVDVKPAVNQLQTSVFCQQHEMQEVMAEYGTKLMSWGPLGGNGAGAVVGNETLAAIGAKYGKSNAQVALRYLMERGVIAIPKSTHQERMQENLSVFDFSLDAQDLEKLSALNEADSGKVNFDDPKFIKWLIETYS